MAVGSATMVETAARVVIVGGGFTGTAVAVHLARGAAVPLSIQIVEPRSALGGGVAYSSSDPAHRTNVAAARMSLFTDDEGHFERWLGDEDALREDPDAVLPDGRIYPRRGVFGGYVAHQLRLAASASPAEVAHLQDSAVEIGRFQDHWRIVLASGRALAADVVVLAVSHPSPAPPRRLAGALGDHPGFVADPWQPGALAAIGRDDGVVIMGMALSMADVVASLDRYGHRGRIVAFSRRGLLSRPHAAQAHGAFGDFAAVPPATALELLVRLRGTVRAAAREGQPWQAVIDAARRDGQAVWRGLDEPQRRALLRHLRPWWEVHRYRVAPQVGAVVARRTAEGSLQPLAAALGAVERHGRGLRCELLLRGRGGARQHRWIEAHAFVVATGPAHGTVVSSNPALHSLERGGHIRTDGFGLGILVDRGHRALSAAGRATDSLLVAGPLARGTFGELMGLPQVAHDAEEVAGAILERIAAEDKHRARSAQPAQHKHYYPDNETRLL